ncbi:unnamed protein product [Urochloa humidicola]
MASKPLMRAYVTFLAGDGDNWKGVVGLAKGLHKAGSVYPLVVAVVPAVPESRRRVLASHGCVIREVEPVHPPDENQAQQFAMADYVANYSKLRIWEFVEYERLVYLDAGIITKVLENMDELFETGCFLPTEEVGCCVLPDVFVLEPGLATAEALLDTLSVTPPNIFDGDRRALAGHGVGKEKVCHHIHIGFFFHWTTNLGFLATAVAVGAAAYCFPAAERFDGLGATLLLFTLAVAVAGVNLLSSPPASAGPAHPPPTKPYCRSPRSPCSAGQPPSLAGTSPATGIILGAAHPMLCFACFALLLLSVSLAVAGLASGSS